MTALYRWTNGVLHHVNIVRLTRTRSDVEQCSCLLTSAYLRRRDRQHPLPMRTRVARPGRRGHGRLMDLIDSSVANLAGPSIRADLGGGQVTVQWVLSAYTAAFALGLVTSGRLGDLLGRRRLFLLGMTGFTLASLACGLAPDVVFLIVARTLQGLFGSVMIPQGLALVKIVFPPRAPAQGADAGRPADGPDHGRRADPGRLAAPPRPVRQPVALDLPDQRPVRHPRRRRSAARPAPPRRRGPRRPPRPHRRRPAHRGLGPADRPAHPGTRARLARLDLRHDAPRSVVLSPCSSSPNGAPRTRSSPRRCSASAASSSAC